MDADGRNMVRLSHHEGNEWHPSVNGNGMIVYSRWDYVDRGHNQAHHPWITTPDGRDPRAIHGNFKPSHDLNPDMELSVVAIPGSPCYVATASAHHWQAYGSLIVIDPRVRDDDALAPVRRLTPDVGFPETAERGTLRVRHRVAVERPLLSVRVFPQATTGMESTCSTLSGTENCSIGTRTSGVWDQCL